MGVEAGWEREGVGGVVENTAFDSAARRLENMTDASFSSEPFRRGELRGTAECNAPAEIVLDVMPCSAQRERGAVKDSWFKSAS